MKKEAGKYALCAFVLIAAGCTKQVNAFHENYTEPVKMNEPQNGEICYDEDPLSAQDLHSFETSAGKITLCVPDRFTAELKDDQIILTCEQDPETYLKVFSDGSFGVCGTGLIQNETSVNDHKAWLSWYMDGPYGYSRNTDWEFVYIPYGNRNAMVILKYGEGWTDPELIDRADQVLHSLKWE